MSQSDDAKRNPKPRKTPQNPAAGGVYFVSASLEINNLAGCKKLCG